MLTLAEMRRRHPAGPPYPEGLLHEANAATPDEVADEFARLAAAARRRRASTEAGRLERDAAEERSALAACGVPERFLSVPADMRRVGAIEAGRGLWLHGPVGSGKTATACGVARGWRRAGHGFLFVSSVVLLAEVRATFGGRGSERDVVARYASAPLLVLDDLGKEVPTADTASRLFEVVDRRWSAGLPTVVTSQLAPAAMADRLAGRGERETAEAIVSRLAGSCDVVALGGLDMRRAS